MVDIHGSWPIILLGFCFVVGVSMWIGYLLGRVRTLDPHGQRLGPGEPGPAVPVVLGIVLVVVGLWVLFPWIASGFVVAPFDGLGVLFALTGLALCGLGVYYVARGLRLRPH